MVLYISVIRPRLRSLFPLHLIHHLPVLQNHRAVDLHGHVRIVRYDDDGLPGGVEGAQERHDLVARFAIQVAGWLVGQDDARAVDERPRHLSIYA